VARGSWTWRRLAASLAAVGFLTAAGFGVRVAEDNQVGYTNDTSLWVFGIAGLFAYYAAIVLFVLLRDRHRRSARAKTREVPT